MTGISFGRLGLSDYEDRFKRQKCRFRISFISKGKSYFVDVINTSRNGICLYTEQFGDFNLNQKITLKSREMGMVSGSVRWIKRGYVGISLLDEGGMKHRFGGAKGLFASIFRLLQPGGEARKNPE